MHLTMIIKNSEKHYIYFRKLQSSIGYIDQTITGDDSSFEAYYILSYSSIPVEDILKEDILFELNDIPKGNNLISCNAAFYGTPYLLCIQGNDKKELWLNNIISNLKAEKVIQFTPLPLFGSTSIGALVKTKTESINILGMQYLKTLYSYEFKVRPTQPYLYRMGFTSIYVCVDFKGIDKEIKIHLIDSFFKYTQTLPREKSITVPLQFGNILDSCASSSSVFAIATTDKKSIYICITLYLRNINKPLIDIFSNNCPEPVIGTLRCTGDFAMYESNVNTLLFYKVLYSNNAALSRGGPERVTWKPSSPYLYFYYFINPDYSRSNIKPENNLRLWNNVLGLQSQCDTSTILSITWLSTTTRSLQLQYPVLSVIEKKIEGILHYIKSKSLSQLDNTLPIPVLNKFVLLPSSVFPQDSDPLSIFKKRIVMRHQDESNGFITHIVTTPGWIIDDKKLTIDHLICDYSTSKYTEPYHNHIAGDASIYCMFTLIDETYSLGTVGFCQNEINYSCLRSLAALLLMIEYIIDSAQLLIAPKVKVYTYGPQNQWNDNFVKKLNSFISLNCDQFDQKYIPIGMISRYKNVCKSIVTYLTNIHDSIIYLLLGSPILTRNDRFRCLPEYEMYTFPNEITETRKADIVIHVCEQAKFDPDPTHALLHELSHAIANTDDRIISDSSQPEIYGEKSCIEMANTYASYTNIPVVADCFTYAFANSINQHGSATQNRKFYPQEQKVIPMKAIFNVVCSVSKSIDNPLLHYNITNANDYDIIVPLQIGLYAAHIHADRVGYIRNDNSILNCYGIITSQQNIKLHSGEHFIRDVLLTDLCPGYGATLLTNAALHIGGIYIGKSTNDSSLKHIHISCIVPLHGANIPEDDHTHLTDLSAPLDDF